MSKLPPIAEESFDGEKKKTELEFRKCQHKLKLISSTEVKCIKCGAGWQGQNAQLLYQASK